MIIFFKVAHGDPYTSNSHYLEIDISTRLDECTEIKGHNTNVDVIYQIVAIRICFQFS
jgi:hypothetical protein